MQAFNPLPPASGIANCISRVAYSFIIRNWYIWANNFLGLLAGILVFVGAVSIGLNSQRWRDALTVVCLLFAILMPVIGAIERLVATDAGTQRLLWGWTGVCLAMAP